MTNKGKIIQIIGPVVDVEFSEEGKLPQLLNALKVRSGKNEIILEVVKHLDPTRVRAISLQSTDGLQRGLEVEDTGKMIEVPVGPEVLGKLFDVCGNMIGEAGNPSASSGSTKKFKTFSPIHRQAPAFTEQSTKTEVFET